MTEMNLASNESVESSEKPSAILVSVEVTRTVSPSPAETATTSLDAVTSSSVESKHKENGPAKKPIDESLSIVIEDDDDDNIEGEEPLVSPPRKSARLSAKRRDSSTENEIGSRKMTDSPVPKRRSMRLNSSSSQDTPPKSREESCIKKMPTITENVKENTQDESDRSAKNNSEQALVDELAAAFVDEFID